MVCHSYIKKLEEVDFVDEEFLCKKINNKDIYIRFWYATENIPEDARRRQSDILGIWQSLN